MKRDKSATDFLKNKTDTYIQDPQNCDEILAHFGGLYNLLKKMADLEKEASSFDVISQSSARSTTSSQSDFPEDIESQMSIYHAPKRYKIIAYPGQDIFHLLLNPINVEWADKLSQFTKSKYMMYGVLPVILSLSLIVSMLWAVDSESYALFLLSLVLSCICAIMMLCSLDRVIFWYQFKSIQTIYKLLNLIFMHISFYEFFRGGNKYLIPETIMGGLWILFIINMDGWNGNINIKRVIVIGVILALVFFYVLVYLQPSEAQWEVFHSTIDWKFVCLSCIINILFFTCAQAYCLLWYPEKATVIYDNPIIIWKES